MRAAGAQRDVHELHQAHADVAPGGAAAAAAALAALAEGSFLESGMAAADLI